MYCRIEALVSWAERMLCWAERKGRGSGWEPNEGARGFYSCRDCPSTPFPPRSTTPSSVSVNLLDSACRAVYDGMKQAITLAAEVCWRCDEVLDRLVLQGYHAPVPLSLSDWSTSQIRRGACGDLSILSVLSTATTGFALVEQLSSACLAL